MAAEITDKKIEGNASRNKKKNDKVSEEELHQRKCQEILIGQLKAAEARNRLRIMRLEHQKNVRLEVEHLIACQPSAMEAVRLQALLPTKFKRKLHKDPMTKAERDHVEFILENDDFLKRNQ